MITFIVVVVIADLHWGVESNYNGINSRRTSSSSSSSNSSSSSSGSSSSYCCCSVSSLLLLLLQFNYMTDDKEEGKEKGYKPSKTKLM